MGTKSTLRFTGRSVEELRRRRDQHEQKAGEPIIIGLLQVVTTTFGEHQGIFATSFYSQEAREALKPFTHTHEGFDIVVIAGIDGDSTPSCGQVDFVDGSFSVSCDVE